MTQFKALLIKELKEAFRDKRALMVAMIMAFMAPIMIFSLSKMMIKKSVETPPIYIKISGAEYAPKLIKALERENILPFSEVPEENKPIWDDRNITLDIPATFNADMLAGRTIDITLRADYSDESSNRPIHRIKDTLWDYSRAIGLKRLRLRGIDIRLLQPIQLIEQDTSVPNSNLAVISMLLGMYLMIAAFMSGLSVSIDSSAGERERNVLELLLSQPVNTLKIILAKLSCASIISAIGVVLTITLTAIALNFVDLTKIGATFRLDMHILIVLALLFIPICLFASALQLFASFHSKSFKEAQSTVSVIVLLPAMSPVILMFIEDRLPWMNWTPILGHSLLMEDLFKGVFVGWGMLAFIAGVTLLLTAALILAMTKKLQSEKAVLALS